jgi:hypothetical protein
MNTQTKTVKRTIVSLKLPVSVPALLQTTKVILLAVAHNPLFPTPDPSLATLQAALSALEEAETAVRSGSRGATAARDEKRRVLGTLLRQLGAYVQKVADGDSSTAEAVIESAGVSVHKLAIRQKQRFTVRQGAVSGSVKLMTIWVGRRASYAWQYSLDGGATWLTRPITLRSKTTVSGLPVGTMVLFRSRAVTKKGEGDWSQALGLLVG